MPEIASLAQPFGKIYIGTAAPDRAPSNMGDIWIDTAANLAKRCSSAAPYTWVSVEGGGGGAPTGAKYVVTALHADLTAEELLSDMIGRGTLAARPAAAIGGRLYFVTDAGSERWTRDTGSAWEDAGDDWDFITGKPTTFTPSAHTHPLADITDEGALAAKNTIATADIDDDAVTYAKIQNISVTDRVLGRAAVGAGDVEEIACTAAGRALIDDADAAAQRTTLGLGALATKSTVATADIDNDAVTYAKLQNVSATDRVLGRADIAGAGDVEEIICTKAGRELIDDDTAAEQRATLGLGALATKSTVATADIANDAVTNAKAANMAANSIKGNNTGSAADPIDLTTAQATAMLDVFTSTLKGVVPASGGGTTNFMRADGTWAAPAGGGGGDAVSVNATAATDVDLDDATPAAPAGGTNVKWQSTGASPTDVSAYVDWGTVALARSRMPFYSTDFLGLSNAATMEAHLPWDINLISSGTQSKIAASDALKNHPGILRFTSSTTANSGARCQTSTGDLLFAGGESAEFIFYIATLTNTTIRMGFHDSVTSADAADGAYVEIPSTGAAVLKTANNSTRTTSDDVPVWDDLLANR